MQDRITSAFGARTSAREAAQGHELSGAAVIVTGASTGIGVETARALAEIGADVTLAVRDLATGEAVAADINRSAARAGASVSALELGDLDSVRAFADRWSERPLHILVNNAGVMGCDQAYTAQGLEMQLGVNHFGHALLALMLAPNLEAGAAGGTRGARLVELTSGGHRESGMRWDDPHFRTSPYDRWKSYGQSKTANVLFAVGFDRRYAAKGVNANAVHPGGIRTQLQRHITPEERERRGWAPLDAPAPNLKTLEQGASTSVWAAVGDELEGRGGLYLEDCNQALPAQEGQGRSGVWPWALDVGEADRLWDLTLETLGPWLRRG